MSSQLCWITPALTERTIRFEFVKTVVGYNGRLRPSDDMPYPNAKDASVQRFVIQTVHHYGFNILASWPIEVEHVSSTVDGVNVFLQCKLIVAEHANDELRFAFTLRAHVLVPKACLVIHERCIKRD